MSLAKVSRKIKRVGKNAVQFRITSTFEFIELECKGSWRPDKLRVIWLRSHRKVKSNDTAWVVSEDFGPNGAKGKAVFNPSISVALVVTLYRDANHTEFDEKEYKYHIENEGPGGKKILATFNCNIAEFVAIPSARYGLDLNFKCVSKKIKVAKLGITLESQFIKEGGANDDDMQSTFSAVSAGQDSITPEDDEEDDEEDEELPVVQSPLSLHGSRGRLDTLKEDSEPPPEVTNNGEISHSSTFTGSHRRTVESKEDYVPPPNPYITEEEPPSPEVPKPPSCTEAWLDPGTVLIDCFEEVVGREKVDQAEIIGLYFSAGWCPPCRRFLPKLVKFYHHLKQHGKSFEIIYISSDYSKQDMMKYMKEQQMPWIGISYEGDVAEEFRKKFSISAVPILKILGNRGEVIEETAKKLVDSASNGSAILKLYNKWHEKVEVESSSEDGKSKERKGILSKVKGFHSKDKTKDSEHTMEHQSSVENGSNSSSETGRMVVDTKTRSKSKTKMALTQEAMEEKEERIHHLEEVNRTLKQTNDDLSEEVSDLRQKLEQVTAELDQLKSTSKTLQDESKELIANLNMRGWLYKRGVRGPTASIFRRRYFRLDQGSKLYYYKNSSEGNPQGYIDLDKVLSVQEVTASQQDKNHATFTVQCDGRTFQLQAHDETNMRKWMEAILYMTRWRKKHSSTFSEDP